jgi:hypothetical protein
MGEAVLSSDSAAPLVFRGSVRNTLFLVVSVVLSKAMRYPVPLLLFFAST